MASRPKLVFLVDYCVIGDVTDYLKGLKKIRVLRFSDIGLQPNADDNRVVEVAAQHSALLITGDKRFTEHHRALCSHAGIIKFEVKVSGRVRCLKKFMHMKQRFDAPKAVTRIYDDGISIRAHRGVVINAPYRR